MASMLTRFQSSGCVPVGTPKTLVYGTPVHNEEALHHHTVDACQDSCNYPRIRCVLNLMEDILSTYYKCTLSVITHK
jgi:hypothetical protein